MGEELQQHAQYDACSSIARLTGLRHLDLVDLYTDMVFESEWCAAGDVLALTALTCLTHLSLSGGVCVTDMKATALAFCLRQLRHLDLSRCELGAMACVGAIAHLSSLTCLKLYVEPYPGCKGLTREGLLMLTRLSRLECLHVHCRSDQRGSGQLLGKAAQPW
jgi:hypothetical protein